MVRLHIKRFAAALLLLTGCGSGSPAPSNAASSGNSNGDDSAGSSGSTSPSSGDDRDATTSPDDSSDAASSGGGVAPDASSSHGDAGSSDASTGPRPSAGCSGTSSAASATLNLTFGGVARTYDLHLPSGSPQGPRPLVVNLHPYTGTSGGQAQLTGMNTLADSEGFLIAYPQGLGSPTDWNAGACCSAASEGDRDDVGFLDAVIDDVAAKSCVDLARVYAIGFSNGGMMTYRLACQDSARFAATASVSGSATVPLDTCEPTHPMPLLHVHGTADPLVPYDGGAGGLPISGRPTPVFPSVADEIATFRMRDSCPSASTVYFNQSDAHCDHWGPCKDGSEVIQCTIAGGGHSWPGGAGAFSETSALDTTQQIWTFLKRHSLP